jgi:hypothetical protein
MKILFEVEIGEDNYIGFEELMYRVDHDEQLRVDLSRPKYGSSTGMFGRLTILSYGYKFTIKDDFIVSVLFSSFINAAINILKNETYQKALEFSFPDMIVFDYIDCGEFGLRIRHYTHKDYYNDADELVFVSSTNYMIQEIMVPKKEFVEQVIFCSEQYFKYSDKLKFPNPHPHYEHWRITLKDLKEQFYNLQ